MLCVQADEWTEGGVVLRGPQLLFLRCLLERWMGVGVVLWWYECFEVRRTYSQ